MIVVIGDDEGMVAAVGAALGTRWQRLGWAEVEQAGRRPAVLYVAVAVPLAGAAAERLALLQRVAPATPIVVVTDASAASIRGLAQVWVADAVVIDRVAEELPRVCDAVGNDHLALRCVRMLEQSGASSHDHELVCELVGILRGGGPVPQVQTLARRLGTTYAGLESRFKVTFGTDPRDAMWVLRVLIASDALTAGRPACEAALSAGVDVRTMQRSFRRLRRSHGGGSREVAWECAVQILSGHNREHARPLK